jgi:cytoskeletal protein CcmA (bactofilin family)
MAGYTRQDTVNNIANGNVIDADDFDAEYNQIESAFNASSGHAHDGSTGSGAPIEKVGPSQDLVVSATKVEPKTTNTLDLGSSAVQFKDAFFDGTVDTDALTVSANGTIGGTLGVTGVLTASGGVTGDVTGTVTGTVSDVSNHDTGDITEGSNLYFTTSRARDSVSATGSLGYNASTGVMSFTQGDTDTVAEGSTNLYYTTVRATADAKAAISVTDAGGDGSLAYSAGVVTYTGPSATEARAHFSAGTGVTYSNGQFSIGQPVSTSDNVTFNNAIVDGNLTVNGTTTTVNSNDVNIGDATLTLNSDETGTPSQDAGITIERGTSANKSFHWDESEDEWSVFGERIKAGTFEGSLTGNATTATELETARTIDITGDITATAVAFDGSSNIAISASVNNDSHTHDGRYYTETESDSRFTASAGDTMTGNLDFEDGAKIRLGGGNDTELFYSGSHTYLDLTVGNFYIRDDNVTKYTFTPTGDFTAAGNVTAYSDERLKSDIVTIPDALDKVCKLRGVNFTKDGEASTGVIAQEVQKVIPEVVLQGDEYLSVAYGNLVGVLIEAVKELKAEVETLKKVQ